MRKATFTLATAILIVLLAVTFAQAQRANQPGRKSPNAIVAQNIDTTLVTVEYGRPAVKERLIWGGLVPFNEVWRAGANEATTIEFSSDVIINGTKVIAGKYSFFVLPTKDSWELILNSEAKQWGAYKYDASKDVLRVKVTPEEHAHVEWMKYYFDELDLSSVGMVIAWEKLAARLTISVE